MGENVQGIRSIIGRYKIDRREAKKSRGNGEANELICMTPGPKVGEYWREGEWQGRGGERGEKNGTTVMA